MKSRPLEPDESELASDLLRNIYWEASERFKNSMGTEEELATIIFEDDDITGIQTFLSGPDFVVCYISFQSDTDDKNVLETLEKTLAPFFDNAEPESLFININGQNKSIAGHFQKLGLRKDKEALEFTFSGKDWPRAKMPDGIIGKGFDDEGFEDYLWLLDTAFRPVLMKEGRSLDPHRRNLKRTYDVLKNASQSGDFQAYWKAESILGLFLLRDNILLDIAVTPVYQGMGIGKAIVSEVLDILVNQRGHEQVLLYVSATNENAIGLYEKTGFVNTASHIDFTYVPPEKDEPDKVINP